MYEILVLPAHKDNYIFILHDSKNDCTAVVDPTDPEVVVALLKEKNWNLSYILNTHHHLDHVNGNLDLKAKTGCQIVGSRADAQRIPGIDILLSESDNFKIGDLTLQVMDMSGHTIGHIAYYAKAIKSLFCGDVLFGLGCGRIFEGTHQQMLKAIFKIRELPLDTKLYCSHEYADKNIDFALAVEPDNQNLLKRIDAIREKRKNNEFTVPLLLEEELQTNPFLRTNQPSLQKILKISAELSLFSYLRNLRDSL
jgi:hydroxyacylglutathione hydrolase